LIIWKSLTSSANYWQVLAQAANGGNGHLGRLALQRTDAFTTVSSVWNDTKPTSTVFTLGGSCTGQGVAYAFHSVDGYSRIGSYVGTGAAGISIVTGFRPAFLLIKNTDSAHDWVIFDNKRDTTNPNSSKLSPNTSGAEYTNSSIGIDFASNGFVIQGTDDAINDTNETHIFMAFAEEVFVADNFFNDDSTVATYKLDGDAGDDSGNGYNGTASNVTYAAGKFDDAAVFNGSSSKITLPNSTAFDVNTTGEFSISAWIKPNTLSSRNPILCSTSTFDPLDSSYIDYRLTLWTNGFPKMDQSYGGGSGTQVSAISSVVANVGQWNHVVGTIKNNGDVKVYLNGVLTGTNTNAGSTTRASYIPTIGTYGSTHKTDGLIDQVRIFDRELDSGEVTQLYNE
jgi:hypothetical protein